MPGASQAQAHRGNGSARIWAYHAVLHGNSADTPPRLLPRLARLRCIHLHDIGSMVDVPSQLGRPEFPGNLDSGNDPDVAVFLGIPTSIQTNVSQGISCWPTAQGISCWPKTNVSSSNRAHVVS